MAGNDTTMLVKEGENIISIVIAAVVVFTILLIQRKWRPASLEDAASSAREFILDATGLRAVPEITGYERVRVYSLGAYRAGLYRASPAPLVLAAYRFVIYKRGGQTAFTLQSLEGAKDPWTKLYDFAGRRGLPERRARSVYTHDITGDGEPDIIIGQYSGGGHCCTTATVVELRKDSVRQLGRIDGLDGLPFEGLDLRKLDKGAAFEIVAHRPYQTVCGSHFDAADVVSIYAYSDGEFTDQTGRFSNFIKGLLRQNLDNWSHHKGHSLHLLQTITAEYAALGQPDQGNRFFASNLTEFVPQLQQQGIDPNTCLEDVANLVDRVASPASSGSGR